MLREAASGYNSGMSTSAIHVDVRPDAVAVLTIDQPGSKVNILTDALWTELEAAVDALAVRADVKGLVIASGKPGIFIAGADIKVFANAPGPNDPTVRAFVEQGLRVLEKLEALPFPTCAAIDGAALGGGLEVALACDYRIVGMNPKVQLGLPEVKLGLIPGWGGTQRLPRIVGWETTVKLLFTGDSFSASEAYDTGLAEEASSDGLIGWAARFLLAPRHGGSESSPRSFLARPAFTPQEYGVILPPAPDTPAGRELNHALVDGTRLPVIEGIKLETEAFLRLAGSDESKRLIAEFFASRKR